MPTLTELLEAGAHFGHKKERSLPKAKKFTYTIRDSVYVIDLEQTLEGLKTAIEKLQKLYQESKVILFVGTKRQAKEAVKRTAEKIGMPYVVERWLGGMLTNYETINKSLKQLEKLEELSKNPEFLKYTKKERKRIEEKIAKILSTFGGLRKMTKIPDALFVVDTTEESVAVLEARKMKIPIIGICDTNANP
ncbi:MAG: rpsB, partial [Candidatus Berkelbacteria bacterium]|nr:rpsB [Candidatus Berkelbacteria bacterium]